jgi:acyl dehydratase
MSDRLFEDLAEGETAHLGRHTVTSEEITTFAEEYTPHPYHTDPEAARDSSFGGLVASGWHTLILCARIVVRTFADRVATVALVGADDLRWHASVRPGDELAVRHEIVEKREARPESGAVRQAVEMTNQDEDVVFSMVIEYLVSRADPPET